MENDDLQHIDLCQSCMEREAKYIVIELDKEYCKKCTNDIFRDYYTEPITKRSDTYKCINDAK